MTLRVTIIGLGRIGTSIGLALKASDLDVYIVGHDKDHGRTSAAKSRRAIDKGDWNLPHSVENADLVILAIPFSAIKETFGYIAQDLRPNAVVMDTATLKVPVLRWAEEVLPETVHFVGGHPIVRDVARGPEHARADLFRKEIFALCPAPSTNAQAVRLVSDIVTLLEARPFFLDPQEHDSMVAAVEHLPQLLSLVLGQTVMEAPAWREMRKLAGAQFEAGTYLGTDSAEEVVDLLTQNKEALLTWMRMLRRTLEKWEEMLTSENEEALIEAVQSFLDRREAWIVAAQTGNWAERPQKQNREKAASFSTWMFGESLARLLRSGK